MKHLLFGFCFFFNAVAETYQQHVTNVTNKCFANSTIHLMFKVII